MLHWLEQNVLVLVDMLLEMALNVLVSVIKFVTNKLFTIILSTIDIDECNGNSTIVCSQQCVNTPGSYQCDCYDGYQPIDVNATQCEGKSYSYNIFVAK